VCVRGVPIRSKPALPGIAACSLALVADHWFGRPVIGGAPLT
jgi:hypothetical protein